MKRTNLVCVPVEGINKFSCITGVEGECLYSFFHIICLPFAPSIFPQMVKGLRDNVTNTDGDTLYASVMHHSWIKFDRLVLL